MGYAKKYLIITVLVCLLVSCFGGCQRVPNPTVPSNDPTVPSTAAPVIDEVDYAAKVKLNMNSATAKTEATVKQFVDGDTTHFVVSASVMPTGMMKVRYLAVNTPESTGKIEEWGKAAAAFTKEKLSAATSIILESETASWDADSTGDRYLCWVWYRTSESEEYRNLNIEILQNGLAIASNSSNNQYGTYCMSAITQAKALKLNVYSGQKDPGFYYGEAVELTLKELRVNAQTYSGSKVAFNGIISRYDNNGVYVESYDSETGMYFGMYVYYGFNLSSAALDILQEGNEVRIVGSLQLYEGSGNWQVSDVNYRVMKPDDPNNIQKLSEGNEASFVLTDPATFANGKVTIQLEEQAVEIPYAQAILNTTVSMKGLKVVGSNGEVGTMTLYCQAPDGTSISIRTEALYDENGTLINDTAYIGKTIDVIGIVDYYKTANLYQIKVLTPSYITITE